MFSLKACLKLGYLLAFFSLPVLAQSYSHEFENPDGSSHLCSSDFSGSTGKTSCVKVPLDERIKHQKNLLKQNTKSANCIQQGILWSQENGYFENGYYYPEYRGSTYRYTKCMAK